MSDSYTEARRAAYAARYGELVDTYTWNLVADAVLAAAVPHVAAAERAKVQPAIDRVQQLAAAAQAKAVEHAVAGERERIARLAEAKNASVAIWHHVSEIEGRYTYEPFADVIREQP